MKYLLMALILFAGTSGFTRSYQCIHSLYPSDTSLDDASLALNEWLDIDINSRDFVRPKIKADHPLMNIMLTYGKNAQNPSLTPSQINTMIKNLMTILSFKNSSNEAIREKLTLNTESGLNEGVTSGWFADNGVWLTTLTQLFENKNLSEPNLITAIKGRYKIEAAILQGNVFEGNALNVLAQTFVDSYFRFEESFKSNSTDLDKDLLPLFGAFERVDAIAKDDLKVILDSRIDYWLSNNEKNSDALFSGLLFFGKAAIAKYFDIDSINKLKAIADANTSNPNLCQNVYASIYETFLKLNRRQ